jgi:hypothetical protein
MTDIPAMLINIRFDAPHLLYWVDQALLCHQAGGEIQKLKTAHILSASDLLFLARIDKLSGPWDSSKLHDNISDVSKSLAGSENTTTQDGEWSPSDLKLRNIIAGLLNTPNLSYVWSYMCNTRSEDARNEVLDNLEKARKKRKDRTMRNPVPVRIHYDDESTAGITE